MVCRSVYDAKYDSSKNYNLTTMFDEYEWTQWLSMNASIIKTMLMMSYPLFDENFWNINFIRCINYYKLVSLNHSSWKFWAMPLQYLELNIFQYT